MKKSSEDTKKRTNDISINQVHKRRTVVLICAALVAATFIAYEPLRYNDFVSCDDGTYITHNPNVNEGVGLESVIWAFTKYHEGHWHPLTWLSHMLDCELFGLNAVGHHFVNLFFHIAGTLLLFLVLTKMTGALWCSAFVAGAFALHPLHVESVAWAAERKDVLSGFFWMLTMAAYLWYVKRPRAGRYLLVAAVFYMGLLSKPMVITLPFVLLLLDYWPLGRFHRRDFHLIVLEKVPLFILSIISTMITFVTQQGTMTSVEGLSVAARIANASISYIKYIAKMFWPSRLAIFYPHPGNKVVIWHGLICALALLAISIFFLLWARKHRYLLTGWLWYLGTLVPVIGLVQVGSQAMADRYTYLPSIGTFIIVAWGGAELVGRRRFWRMCLGVSAGLFLVASLLCTRAQVRHWRNSVSLFEHAITVVPNNQIAYNFLGRALERQGRLDEAASQFIESLRINPNDADTKNELARILIKQGKNKQVVRLYSQFLPKLPDDANTAGTIDVLLAGRGKFSKDVRDYTEAHAHLGTALLNEGRVDEAIRHFEEVLKFRPDFVDSHKQLGRTLLQQNKPEEAARVFRKVLQIQPDDADAHIYLGAASLKQGKVEEAIERYSNALAIKPDSAGAHNNLGYALTLKGDFDEAIREYRKSLQIQPDEPSVLNALGISLGKQGKLDEAIECFNKALLIEPDSAEARDNLEHARSLRDRLGKEK